MDFSGLSCTTKNILEPISRKKKKTKREIRLSSHLSDSSRVEELCKSISVDCVYVIKLMLLKWSNFFMSMFHTQTEIRHDE